MNDSNKGSHSKDKEKNEQKGIAISNETGGWNESFRNYYLESTRRGSGTQVVRNDSLVVVYWSTQAEPKQVRKLDANFPKEDTTKILFSDEEMFDIDRIYKSQNPRVWTANHTGADTKGGTKQKRVSTKSIDLAWPPLTRGFSDLFRG